MEIWKSIKGFEGYYEVSNLGRIRSLNRIVSHSKNGDTLYKGKDISLNKISSGYFQVELKKDKLKRRFMVHRLVAENFLEVPNDTNIKCIEGEDISKYLSGNRRIEVNHIDEDKSNNSVENLEWCTRLYNLKYGSRPNNVSKASIKTCKIYKENKIGIFSPESHKKSAMTRTGVKRKSHKTYTKKSYSIYHCIETGETMSSLEATKKYNITFTRLSNAANPKNKIQTAGGYHWKKLD